MDFILLSDEHQTAIEGPVVKRIEAEAVPWVNAVLG